MKIGILISTDDPETLWNAFRFGILCLNMDYDNEVTIFLNARATAYEEADSEKFNIKELAKSFVLGGGKIIGCQKSMGFRGLEGNEICQKGGQKDLYELLMSCDRFISF
ncbi:MAG: DsrE family protein [Thermodesulfovibrio sp.]|nr:DsrE family protein [Thermodesulfovibrio sp.]MDW7972411.1 DsrE family protein [Thermodesulfovibrio sp.]